MDRRVRGRERGRSTRQHPEVGGDRGPEINQDHGQGSVAGDPVVTAINRITDVLERMTEHQAHGARQVTFAAFQFEGAARSWWNLIRVNWDRNHTPRTWANFTREFNAKFLPPLIQEKREDDFIKCRQGAVSVAEYEIQFTKLFRFAPELVATEQRRIRRFVQRLNVKIQEGLATVRIDTFADAVERAQRVEVARAQVKSFQAKKRFGPNSSREPTYANAPPAKVGRGTGGVNSPGTPRGALAKGAGARSAGGRDIGARGRPSGRSQTKNAPQGGRVTTPQVTCGYCRRAGHTEDRYWRKEGKCLKCGSSEHQVVGCPKIQEGGTPSARQATSGGNRPKVPARVYVIVDQPVPDSSEVVEGTLPIFYRLARVLIDPGTTHSFVNPTFMSRIDEKPVKLPFDLEVRTPMGNKSIITSLAYKNCEFWVGEHKMLVDLVSLDIKGYDVIIGMDFLSHYHAKLDCRAKVVEFWISGEATLKLDVKDRLASSAMISGVRARKMLYKGAQGFLAFLINAPSDQVKLEDVPVVRKFPDVFPEELKTLPPEREVEFKIELVPGMAPISKTPYRIAPAELKELKIQLQDLLERGFVRENDSPWGPPPETPTEVRSFLGLAGYYRRFIKDFSKIAGPMTELTKKNNKFIWTPKCESSFQKLKKRFTSAPVLALPNGVEGYVVFSDASKEGTANVVAYALSRKAQVAGLMVKEWNMLEEVSVWNPRLERLKILFGNL
ncbi:uncharacterized protein [Coffea arabica]|uniref:Retrotransposon gag domain-containing protein n=1 Tax=Coffea arabica TaxID=13443 RepID=A0ABM4VCC3_COFAR